MTDDYLADFERELHAAAQRRQAPSRARRRLLAVAMATAAAAAAAAIVLTLAAPGEREVEVPAGLLPAGHADDLQLVELAPSTCGRAQQVTLSDRDRAPRQMAIFKRSQRAPDAPDVDQMRGIPAGDYDLTATRSPTGIGARVLLSPTRVPLPGCAEPGPGEPGVCLISGAASRCFGLSEIEAGRALVLAEPETVIGMVPDGVESVSLEAGGEPVLATVAENAFLAKVAGAKPGTRVGVRFNTRRGEGCTPTAALLRAVPALEAEPPAGGVPPAIRRSVDGRDSAVIGRHARLWGGGDGVAYWIVPQLQCDGADADEVCVVPLFEGEEDAEAAGGSACATPAETGRTWIHFPLRDGGAAVAGLAPPGASDVRVRTREGGVERRFAVKGGVWGGTLEGYRPRGEVGSLVVEFDVAAEPTVAVLNGTTVNGLATSVMGTLTDANLRRGEIGEWTTRDVTRTVVYHAPGKAVLGEKIALYLRERTMPPMVREMTAEARRLGDGADAVVVVGADLIP
jgi:hypothetical protein